MALLAGAGSPAISLRVAETTAGYPSHLNTRRSGDFGDIGHRIAAKRVDKSELPNHPVIHIGVARCRPDAISTNAPNSGISTLRHSIRNQPFLQNRVTSLLMVSTVRQR